jgi:hypothetical protein
MPDLLPRYVSPLFLHFPLLLFPSSLLPPPFLPILPPSPSLRHAGKIRAASGIYGSPIEDLILTLLFPFCALAQEVRQANAEGRPVKEFVTGDVLVGEGGGREGWRGRYEAYTQTKRLRVYILPTITFPFPSSSIPVAPPLRGPNCHR